jgi:hypothetical protein
MRGKGVGKSENPRHQRNRGYRPHKECKKRSQKNCVYLERDIDAIRTHRFPQLRVLQETVQTLNPSEIPHPPSPSCLSWTSSFHQLRGLFQVLVMDQDAGKLAGRMTYYLRGRLPWLFSTATLSYLAGFACELQLAVDSRWLTKPINLCANVLLHRGPNINPIGRHCASWSPIRRPRAGVMEPVKFASFLFGRFLAGLG